MEFSWTTFFLEIINFLVLVWILQRFLYKPVMKVIAQRKAHIESRLEEAKAIQTAAQRRKMEEESFATASRFAALLLSRIANAQLEDRIRELMIEELSSLPQDKIQSLRQACEGSDMPLKITSAYPVDEDARTTITQALASLIAKPVVCNFVRNPDLLAGFHISVGFWALDCNLKNGLSFFAEATRRAG